MGMCVGVGPNIGLPLGPSSFSHRFPGKPMASALVRANPAAKHPTPRLISRLAGPFDSTVCRDDATASRIPGALPASWRSIHAECQRGTDIVVAASALAPSRLRLRAPRGAQTSPQAMRHAGDAPLQPSIQPHAQQPNGIDASTTLGASITGIAVSEEIRIRLLHDHHSTRSTCKACTGDRRRTDVRVVAFPTRFPLLHTTAVFDPMQAAAPPGTTAGTTNFGIVAKPYPFPGPIMSRLGRKRDGIDFMRHVPFRRAFLHVPHGW